MEMVEAIQKAGVVGAGGAGFPTHVKLNAKAEYFIVNAAECEPLIETDKYLCRTCSDSREDCRTSGSSACSDCIKSKICKRDRSSSERSKSTGSQCRDLYHADLLSGR